MGEPIPVPPEVVEQIRIDAMNLAEAAMDRLTPDERKQVIGKYCRGCGDKRAHCPCERDE